MSMHEEIQEEVVHCPNCKEEVPKTLYCLNCGFPLYKEVASMEEAPKPETEVQIEAYMEPDEVYPEPKVEEEVANPIFEGSLEEAKVDDALMQTSPTELDQMNLPETTEKGEETYAQSEEEGAHEAYLEEDKPPEQETQADAVQEVETVQVETEGSELGQAEEGSKTIEEEPAEVVQEEAPKVSEKSSWKYDPDPLVQEILKNIARNLSLKVKLSKLMLDGALKESTFLKLLERYSAQGDRWISRRNEIVERDRYDIDSMEKALDEARIAMDELEIRKAIGDALDDEYQAKMPAYKWEINSLAGKIREIKGEVEYLNDINNVLPAGEVDELKSLVEQCYESINNLSVSETSGAVRSRVKEVLDEALELVKGSPYN
ncbi:MAG: hypothetical protein ACUVV4_05535 [Candidatus Bathyarchaeia archaeon]